MLRRRNRLFYIDDTSLASLTPGRKSPRQTALDLQPGHNRKNWLSPPRPGDRLIGVPQTGGNISDAIQQYSKQRPFRHTLFSPQQHGEHASHKPPAHPLARKRYPRTAQNSAANLPWHEVNSKSNVSISPHTRRCAFANRHFADSRSLRLPSARHIRLRRPSRLTREYSRTAAILPEFPNSLSRPCEPGCKGLNDELDLFTIQPRYLRIGAGRFATPSWSRHQVKRHFGSVLKEFARQINIATGTPSQCGHRAKISQLAGFHGI